MPPPRGVPTSMSHRATQTDMTQSQIDEIASRNSSDIDSLQGRIDSLQRSNEELSRQLNQQSKVLESKQQQLTRCIEVVKQLLIVRCNIEKEQARTKCSENRLRLGQFVTQRVGASFQENWQDGYAFQEISKRQEKHQAEKEELDRQRKLLLKRKPADPASTGGRKRLAAGNNTASPVASNCSQSSGSLTNGLGGADHENRELTLQEYYEAEEILKVIYCIVVLKYSCICLYFLYLFFSFKKSLV